MTAADAVAWIGYGVLFGDQERFAHMGRRFQQGGSTLQADQLLVLMGVLSAVLIVVWLLSRYLALRETRGHRSPRRMFRELCRAHGLGWEDRQLLRQLARWHRLPSASLLFLDAQRFDTQTLGPMLDGHAERLQAIRARLFADG